jgi:hypothetical protein
MVARSPGEKLSTLESGNSDSGKMKISLTEKNKGAVKRVKK